MDYITAKEWSKITTDNILTSIEIAIRVLRYNRILKNKEKEMIRQLAIDLLQLTV